MRNLLILLASVLLAPAGLLGCSFDDIVPVHSCSVNENDTLQWTCSEAPVEGPCEATPPATAKTGDGCPGGASSTCEFTGGAVFHYNVRTDAEHEALQQGCGQGDGSYRRL
jgi:hypothetical protein